MVASCATEASTGARGTPPAEEEEEEEERGVALAEVAIEIIKRAPSGGVSELVSVEVPGGLLLLPRFRCALCVVRCACIDGKARRWPPFFCPQKDLSCASKQ